MDLGQDLQPREGIWEKSRATLDLNCSKPAKRKGLGGAITCQETEMFLEPESERQNFLIGAAPWRSPWASSRPLAGNLPALPAALASCQDFRLMLDTALGSIL